MFDTHLLYAQEVAVEAIRAKAAEMHIQGVGVALVWKMQDPTSCSPTVKFVGQFHRGPKPERGPDDVGANYLAVALAKLAQMQRTWKPSGQAAVKGENDFPGGDLIELDENTLLLAAFSGGTGEEDMEIAQAGLAAMKEFLSKPGVSPVEHISLWINTGHMADATNLFRRLGWKVWPNRSANWDSGLAMFVYPPEGGVYIQFTEETSQMAGDNGSASHFALAGDVNETLATIRAWCDEYNYDLNLEDVGGGKQMITIPFLFQGAIELVPCIHSDLQKLVKVT